MSALRRRDACVSDLAFDEWLGDALTPSAQRELDAHLEHCARCTTRHVALLAERAAFLKRVPNWNALAERVAPSAPRPSIARRFSWAAAAAAAAIAITFMLPRTPAESVRSKGAPRIGAFVKHAERVERIESGAVVQPGDYVRFTYSSQLPSYFALFNRDGSGATTYFPLEAQSVRMQAGSEVPLDFSIRLDAQPGEERVHGLFCDEPQPLEPLRAQLAATGRLPQLANCHIDVLTLTKGKPNE